MRKKRIASKLLSLLLSAAVIVSSSFSGITLMDVSATQTAEQVTVAVSDNTTEDVADDLEETDVEENNLEKVEMEEASEEETTEEIVAEDKPEEKAGVPEIGVVEGEDVNPEKKETDMTLLVAEVVKDAELLTALVDIYNTGASSVAKDTMTLGDMKELQKIDLSDYPKISSIEGLTYAENATEINLAGTAVKMIPANEFQSFASLTTIVLPDELEGIGNFAFQNCKSLTEINVSVDGGEVVKNTLPSSLREGNEEDGCYTGSAIFSGCVKLTEINIPDLDEGKEGSLQKAASIFSSCTGLKEIHIAKNVANIPASAFEGAGISTGMTVTFAEGSEMKMIASGAFKNANLSQIDLSNCLQLAEIGDSCFSAIGGQQVKLAEIKLPAKSADSAMKIGKDAFFRAPLSAMYIEEKEEGFVCIPDYVISLGAGAFYENKVMTKLQISANMQEIAEHTFDNCTALANVIQSKESDGCQITRIGNAAFRKTTALTSAAFLGDMDKLVKIGDEKLTVVKDAYVKELNYITGKVSNYNYGSDVFRGSAIVEAVFPASLRVINSRSFCKALSLETVTWKNGTLKANQVFEINSEAFHGCSSLREFKYSNMVQGDGAKLTVEQYAFDTCTSLVVFSENGKTNADGTKNALPQSLIKLGKCAFKECSVLPAMSVKNKLDGTSPIVGEYVFYKAFALAQSELPAALQSIPLGMYYDAALTQLPTFEGGKNSIQSIDNMAFFGNRIENADLSAWTKLTSIGNMAFAYVDTSSATIYYADEYLAPPLKSIVLPEDNASSKAMSWGANMLQGAEKFKTLSTPSWRQEGVVYIPNYVKESGCASGVFATTGVEKAYWGFVDKASGANVWTGIPAAMFFATDVANLEDCCIPRELLKTIGDRAYASCCELTVIDLSVYPVLSKTGDGSFANCSNVTKVSLPDNGLYYETSKNMFRSGFFTGMAAGSATYSSAIEEIDFGGVEILGSYCFATANEKADSTIQGSTAYDIWPSSLESLDFAGSYVEVIGQGAFKGNSGLETVDFGNVITIGISAFEQCENLNLTQEPMSDSVKVIGNHAFYRCVSIGKVTFGEGLTQIGTSAFEQCALVNNVSNPTSMTEGTGLTQVDFSKAKNLVTIANRAFYITGLTKLDLTATAVKNFDNGAYTFANNPYLTEVKLSESLQRVGENVFCGCVRMNYFSFYSTTTVSKTAFNVAGRFTGDNSNKTTPISKMAFEVKPVELNVGLGRAMKFPYYVNEYVQNQTIRFDEMYIGSAGNTDDTICKYVKVSAATAGYYLNELDGQAITDSRYFEQVTDTSRMITTINNKKILAFDIQGLQATPEGESIPFTVTNEFKFASADSEGGISKKVTTTFNLKVMEIPYYPVIYTDVNRTQKEESLKLNESTGLTSGTMELRAGVENPSGMKTFWYDIKTMVKSNWQPDSGNLIIKTSDPSIVIAYGATKVAGTTDTWKVEAPYTSTVTNVSDVTKNKSFSLRAIGHGDAVVTIYPENCPQKKITWKVQVRADIRSVDTRISTECANGVYVGMKVPLLNSFTTYLGKTVYYKDGSLMEYKKYTDNVLEFVSPDPKTLSIDQYGVATILKVTNKYEPCVLYIWSPLGQKLMEFTTMLNAKYKQITYYTNSYADTGETVRVTKISTGNGLTEVTYVAPKAGTKSVVIPDTMYVYGVKCKVTAIDPVAFAGNKTLESVTIGKNVTMIPAGAFKGCTKLTTVNIKGKLTEIGDSAFEKCSSLKKITIPKTVKKIGNKAFCNCKKLTTVTFKKKSKLESIGDSAFQGCKLMKKITIPSTYLTTIGAKAFNKCTKLNKIVIKSKVVITVGTNAFKGIAKKAIIDVPNSKLSVYQTLFKKGQGKKVKIK